MKRVMLFFVLLFINLCSISAQENYSVKGNIIDEHDGTALTGVSIFIVETKGGTVSDNAGDFHFNNIPAGNYTLKFSLIGHKNVTKSVTVPSTEAINIKVAMQDEAINLNDIVVTGSSFLGDSKNVTQATITVDKLDLQIKRSQTIGQTLNFQPGIAMVSNGIAPSRPVIRGFGSNRILILEDGLRMGDLSGSSGDHAVSEDAGSPERIEILRGPSSLLYGSNALGGVINVMTGLIPATIPQNFSGSLNLNGASVNNQKMGSLQLGYGAGRFSFEGNYFSRKASDYKSGGNVTVLNSDIESQGISGGISYNPSWGNAGIGVNNFTTRYGIPLNPEEAGGEGPILIDLKKTEVRGTVEIDSLAGSLSTLNIKTGYQDYHHSEIARLTGETGTEFSLKTGSADISLRHKLTDNINGAGGIWFLKQKYEVTGEEALTPNADYTGFAVYLFEQIKLGSLSLQAGGRYERNGVNIPEAVVTDSLFSSADKIFNSVSGSIGFVYNISDKINLYGNFANAFRAPTVEELSSYAVHEATGSFDIGSRDLKKENNYGFDFGLRANSERYYAEISGYYNSISNYIFRNPTSLFFSSDLNENNIPVGINDSTGLQVFRYMQTDAAIYGFEAKFVYDFTEGFSATAIADMVTGKDKTADTYLPLIPPFRFSLEPKYVRDYYWFGFNWKVAAEQKNTAPEEEPTKGYGIVDLFGGFKFITGNYIHQVDLKVENLLDQQYKDHLSAIKSFAGMPGRNFYINYKILF